MERLKNGMTGAGAKHLHDWFLFASERTYQISELSIPINEPHRCCVVVLAVIHQLLYPYILILAFHRQPESFRSTFDSLSANFRKEQLCNNVHQVDEKDNTWNASL